MLSTEEHAVVENTGGTVTLKATDPEAAWLNPVAKNMCELWHGSRSEARAYNNMMGAVCCYLSGMSLSRPFALAQPVEVVLGAALHSAVLGHRLADARGSGTATNLYRFESSNRESDPYQNVQQDQ